MTLRTACFALSCCLVACSRPAPPAPVAEATPTPAIAPAAALEQRREAPGRRAVAGVDWVEAPAEGDVATQVRQEWARAKRDGRSLLLYVGAKWCEPCRYFHDAVQARRFDGVADGLRLLAYDLDRDKERLEAAGYGSDMIPLLAGTAPDGRGTARKFQGAVKGPEAVDYITPRLQRLLASQRRFDARVGEAENNLRNGMDRGTVGSVVPAGTATPAARP